MKPNTDIYFSQNKHNWRRAKFLKDLEQLNGEAICRIELDGNEWTVRRSEIHNLAEHDNMLSQIFYDENRQLIDAVKSGGRSKAEICRTLKMDYRLGLRRLKRAEEFGLL